MTRGLVNCAALVLWHVIPVTYSGGAPVEGVGLGETAEETIEVRAGELPLEGQESRLSDQRSVSGRSL